jgi:hypothetical protein
MIAVDGRRLKPTKTPGETKKGGEHEKMQKGKTAVGGPASELKSKALEEPTQVGKAAVTKPAPGVPVVPKQ